jgi:hypothetical protein
MDEEPPERICSGCGDPWPPDTEPGQWTCSCGSTRRTNVLGQTAEVRVEAPLGGGRIKSDKRMASGKPALEKKFGGDLHRDSGTMRSINRTVDRKNDRYEELITELDGTVVRDVAEPLSEHQGHGSARRPKP